MHKPTLEVNLAAIVRNYEFLRKKGAKSCAAVVKANAYGLGMVPVAAALYKAGCHEFFVATLDEAIELRKAFATQPATIYVFHGVRKGQARDFLAHDLIPVLNDPAQLEAWQDSGKYALHIDTGMCRLGFTPKQAGSLSPTRNLHLVISHLACANEPNNPKDAQQLALFREALRRFPRVRASFANSSGVFLGGDFHFDLLRPGCSLYGISPNTALPNPMENVVTLSAPILQYREIDADQTVGYSATYTAKKGAVLATVEFGYADGLFRNLSNKVSGFAAGIRIPLVGRVSMDMVSMDVSAVPENLRTPDLRVTFIGEEQPVDAVAVMAGTIGYEVFTRLGARVKRAYFS